MPHPSKTQLLRALAASNAAFTGEPPEAVLRETLRSTVELLEADRGIVVVPTKDAKVEFVVRAGHNLDGAAWRDEELYSRTFVRAALGREKALLSKDPLDDPLFENSETVEALPVRSILGAPLVAGGKTHGAIVLHEKSRGCGPFDEDDRRFLDTFVVRLAFPLAALLADSAARERAIPPRRRFRSLVGGSKAMLDLFSELEKACGTTAPVLILGESGTGKELVARAIHDEGKRAQAPFVALNVTELSEHLLESELFGHEKGAFTGAHAANQGLFRAANGGTLFLDEIGDMPTGLQAKLLRVLDQGEVRPVGSPKTFEVDVRIVAATHRDLERLVEEERFREDLYYRLSVLPIETPPLRERGEDVIELARCYIARWAAQEEKPTPSLSPRATAALREHDWPGNVRELANVMRRAVIASHDPIEPADLKLGAREPAQRKSKHREKKLTRAEIRKAIAKAPSVAAAAKLLGAHRSTLYRNYPELRDL